MLIANKLVLKKYSPSVHIFAFGCSREYDWNSTISLRKFSTWRKTRSRLIEGVSLARINEASNISADRAEFTMPRRPTGRSLPRRDRQLDSNRRRLKLPRIRRDISGPLETDRRNYFERRTAPNVRFRQREVFSRAS